MGTVGVKHVWVVVGVLLVVAGCSGPATQTAQSAVPVAHASAAAASPDTSVAAPSAAPVAATSSAPKPKAAVLPLSADTVLAGNADPTYGPGDPNMLAMLDQGPAVNNEAGTASMPIAVRNNVGQAVAHVDVSATASVNGKIVATGDSIDTSPSQIQPGQVALVDIAFQSTVPKGATFDYTAHMLPADTSSANTANLKVTQANLVNGSVVGSAVNDNAGAVTGPYSVEVYCFVHGKLASVQSDFGSVDANLAHGDATPFSVDLLGAPCTTYEVGASGYFT